MTWQTHTYVYNCPNAFVFMLAFMHGDVQAVKMHSKFLALGIICDFFRNSFCDEFFCVCVIIETNKKFNMKFCKQQFVICKTCSVQLIFCSSLLLPFWQNITGQKHGAWHNGREASLWFLEFIL